MTAHISGRMHMQETCIPPASIPCRFVEEHEAPGPLPYEDRETSSLDEAEGVWSARCGLLLLRGVPSVRPNDSGYRMAADGASQEHGLSFHSPA